MELSGTIKVVESIIEKGTFKSRNVVITTDEQYPQQISVQFVQDKCDLLDKFKVGQEVKIGINLRGREWVDPQGVSKYFNTIQGWNINAFAQSEPTPKVEPLNEHLVADTDDMPF